MRIPTNPLAFPAALTLAVLAHAALVIPFLSTQSSSAPPTMRDLAVTLAAPSQDERPDKAGFQAIANQSGAGDNAHLQRLTAPQTERQHDSLSANDSRGKTQGHDAQSSQGVIATRGNQDRLLGPGEWQLEQAGDTQIAGKARAPILAELDLDRLQTLGYGSDPGQSVATLKNARAGYIQRWRQHIQTVGTGQSHQWPDLTGAVKIRTTLDFKGRLLSYEILSSSSLGRLDQAAISVLKQSDPFEPFPNAMVAAQDRISITRIWQFNKGRNTLR